MFFLHGYKHCFDGGSSCAFVQGKVPAYQPFIPCAHFFGINIILFNKSLLDGRQFNGNRGLFKISLHIFIYCQYLANRQGKEGKSSLLPLSCLLFL